MAHFVMQNLERSFAKLETQTYKETCVFPQFNYVRKTLEQLNYILMEGPYSLHSRLSQVYTAPAALSQVCSTKWFSYTANFYLMKTTGTGNWGVLAGKICTIYGKGL